MTVRLVETLFGIAGDQVPAEYTTRPEWMYQKGFEFFLERLVIHLLMGMPIGKIMYVLGEGCSNPTNEWEKGFCAAREIFADMIKEKEEI